VEYTERTKAEQIANAYFDMGAGWSASGGLLKELREMEDGYIKQLADAQATIAALQARVKELEEWQQIVAGTQDRQDLIYRLSDHLTQRTAERDTARRRVDELEAREVDVVLLRDDLEQRTAELEAANDKVQFLEKKNRNLLDSENLTLKVKADQDVRLASLQAELERVRGEVRSVGYETVKELCEGFMNVMNQRQELRDLILALPKVEGEIMVSESLVLAEDPDMCSDMSDKEEATAYAALLKHRQGMEN